MVFANPQHLCVHALENGYAVPALNTNGATYDITRACLESAQEERAPVILQVYEPNSRYRGMAYFRDQVSSLCDDLGIDVPVAIQLDHGKSFQACMTAIRAGFTGVMMDGSHLPVHENAEAVSRVLEAARSVGVSVEAEIGHVGGNEPGTSEPEAGRVEIPEEPLVPPVYSDPDEVAAFLEQVDVDLLAVSVGTLHGIYKHQRNIDFDLVRELRSRVSVPLVQHGTGGVSLSDLEKLVDAGMTKINFGEPFRYNYIRYFMKAADELVHQWHPWRIAQHVKDALKQDINGIIRALGATGRASARRGPAAGTAGEAG